MNQRRFILRLTVPTIALACLLTAATAGAANSSGTSPDSQQPPNLLETVPQHSGSGIEDNIPDHIHEVAATLYTKADPVSLEWDDETLTLTAWVDSEASAKLSEEIAQDTPGVRVELTQFTTEELQAAVAEVVDAGHVGASDVQWAAPKPDGSGIDVGIVDRSPMRSQQRDSGPSLRSSAGVPVETVPDGEAEIASRDFDAGPEFIAGADIARDSSVAGRIRVCTSAFAVNAFTSGQTEEMLLTADHCIQSPGGNVWRAGRYTNSPEMGTHTYNSATATDIGRMRGKDYAPYMYYGPNTSNNAVAIHGWAAPIVGSTVCYSGAPSGTVCSNQVTHVGVTVNYAGNPGLTYSGMSRTVQLYDLPAVGNGDSGGPVFGVNASSEALAVGIISGMSNANDNCTGDPATETRKCSTVAFYGPIAEYFAMNPLDSLQTY